MVVDFRSLGSGKVEFTPGRPIIHFGSPSAVGDAFMARHEAANRAAKKRALEDFWQGEVPDSTVDRVEVRDAGQVHPFTD